MIEKVELASRGQVRRAKLYYLRDLRGKAAKIRNAATPEASAVAQPRGLIGRVGWHRYDCPKPLPGFDAEPVGSTARGAVRRGRSRCDQSPSTPEHPTESKGSSAWRAVREVLIVLVTAVLLSVVVRTFFVQAFYVPSQSMENTLLPSDRILASKITTNMFGVKRGRSWCSGDPAGGCRRRWSSRAPASAGAGVHRGGAGQQG